MSQDLVESLNLLFLNEMRYYGYYLQCHNIFVEILFKNPKINPWQV